MTTTLDVTDLFCGAGGSGLGAKAAGFELKIAANHWQRAIETHALNFPETEHDCADISQVDPRRYPATAVLWASPECTNHSQARGVVDDKQPDLFGEILPTEAAERSRATMWDVPRFVEAMIRRGRPYRAVVVENVVEASRWLFFEPWLTAMKVAGYEHQFVSLNSMHAPAVNAPRAPQSRDRLYIVFHHKSIKAPKVDPRPLAWCQACGDEVFAIQAWKPGRHIGKYRQQYTYVCPTRGHQVEPYALPAAAAIDWGLPGQRIGDRARPLSEKTMARIEAGLRKFARPMTFEAAGNTFVRVDENGVPRYVRGWPVDEPTRALTASETRALVVPVEGRDAVFARPAGGPFRAQTGRHQDALVVPYYGNSRTAVPADRPLPTQGTRDTCGLLVPSGGTWHDEPYLTDDPMRTVTARENHGIAFVAELRGMNASHDKALRGVDNPLAAVTAGGNHHMLVRHNGDGGGQPGWQCTMASEPMRTLTTGGHQSVVSIEPKVDDATFRMLEPHEIQAAMAFTADYKVTGTRREQVRQLGNGVTPPAAEFLLGAVRASLEGTAA